MVKSRTSSDEDEDYYPSKKAKEEGDRIKNERRRIYHYRPQNKNLKLESFKEIKRRLHKINILIDRQNRASDQIFVKNFCVLADNLTDDFVMNALIGNIKWNNIADKNKLKLKKERKKIAIQSSLQSDYLFDDNSIDQLDLNFKNDDENKLDDYFELTNDFNENNNQISREIRSSFKNKQSTNSINKLFRIDSDIDNINRILRYINNSKKSFNNSKSKSNSFLDKFKIKTNQELNQELQSYRPIKCFMCSYTTTSIQHLVLHSSSHHNYCDLCKISLKSIFGYFRHIGFHLKETQLVCLFKLEFKCTCCSIIFKEDHKLEEHFNLMHTFIDQRTVYGEQTIRFKCKICNQIDLTLKSLNDHFNSNHLNVKCPIKNCELWLKNLEQLEQHAFNQHKSFINNYECEYCSKIFAFKQSYNNHLKLKHSILIIDNDKYCLFCNKLFNDYDNDLIIEHLADHTNIYLYDCDTCDLKTNSKSKMIEHSMKIKSTDQDDEHVFIGNCVDLNVLWTELSKINKNIHEDLIIKDQLEEAIATIL